MNKHHRKTLDFGNPLRQLVGQPFYCKKPSDKKILNELLSAMSKFSGTCWDPVSIESEGYDLMLRQCPGSCGHVWKLTITDRNVSSWLVNEINRRRAKIHPLPSLPGMMSKE